ncbi:hypothetical protein SEA_SNAZZY_64 [Mycobacterium phage Snazzy]|nr:hypothetical protein SEA_SNAZZY_64 [Mycobacterium phage Snazzy]
MTSNEELKAAPFGTVRVTSRQGCINVYIKNDGGWHLIYVDRKDTEVEVRWGGDDRPWGEQEVFRP